MFIRNAREKGSDMTLSYNQSQKSKKQHDKTKMPSKLRLHNDCGPPEDGQVVNNSHPTGVVKPVTGTQPSHLP